MVVIIKLNLHNRLSLYIQEYLKNLIEKLERYVHVLKIFSHFHTNKIIIILMLHAKLVIPLLRCPAPSLTKLIGLYVFCYKH